MNGTNALALYRLTRVPEKKEKRKRPRNIAISINNISEIGIDYLCPSCGKSTNIKSTTSIQCIHCDHRILEKPRINKAITLNAV